MALEAWATGVSNLLAIASVKVDDLTPVRFKQELQRPFVNLQGEVASRQVLCRRDFKFGFDRYLGDSDSLPQAADVPQLARRLNLIQTLVRTLCVTNIVRLTSLWNAKFSRWMPLKRRRRALRGKRPSAAVPKPGRSLALKGAAVSDTLNPALSPCWRVETDVRLPGQACRPDRRPESPGRDGKYVCGGFRCRACKVSRFRHAGGRTQEGGGKGCRGYKDIIRRGG